MDGMFEGEDVDKIPRFRSLHEAFRQITGRTFFKPQDVLRESISYAPAEERKRLSESIATTTWAEILGDSITRKMIKEYKLPDLQEWRKVVSEIAPIKDFRTNRRMLVGGYGDLPEVTQGDNYNALSSPTDDENTYSVKKRGGTEDLTLETVANDDVGAVKRIPKKLGGEAARTLYKAIFDLFKLNTATCYDGKVIFHVDHNNLGSTAMSDAGLTATKSAMMKQTSYGNAAEKLGMANVPKLLIGPTELEPMMFKLTTSKVLVGTNQNETAPNIHSTYGLGYIVVSYWDDVNDWVAIADPQNVPTIEVGFFEGKEEPELFVQDMPNVGSVFTADKITYKIRHIWGLCLLDYVGMYKHVVA